MVEHIKTYRQYKLSEAKEPPPTQFISLTGKEADLLTQKGFAYFESLARYINENPPRSQDMAMLGMLETLGIAHGRPFEPDEPVLFKGCQAAANHVHQKKPYLDEHKSTIYALDNFKKL